MRFMGVLRQSENGRWIIQAENGDSIELSCGMMACFYVNGRWEETTIEHSSRMGYYAMHERVRLVDGLRAGTKVW